MTRPKRRQHLGRVDEVAGRRGIDRAGRGEDDARPTGTVTGVLMWPLPGGDAGAAPGAGTGPRHAGQCHRERVGDRGANRVARPERIGHGDGVGRRLAGDHAVDPVGLRDVEIGHRRRERRVGGRALVARWRRQTRHRRRVDDRIGRRIAGRDREGRRDRAGGAGRQRAERAREGRRARAGVRDERQAGGRRVGERGTDRIRGSRIRDDDRVDDVGPRHGVGRTRLGDLAGRRRASAARNWSPCCWWDPHRRRRLAP